MNIDLREKLVVVTGGSRGIGASCSRFFAKAGATVLVHCRSNLTAANSVLQGLEGAHIRNHFVVAADLSQPQEVQSLFDSIAERWGRIDVLVNNAGIWVENSMHHFDADKLESTWMTNVRGVFLSVAAALPLFTGDDSNIVNLSSTAGQRGEAGYSPYAATKGALIAATKSWSSELAPGIRVNAVAPGWVDTEMCEVPFSGAGRREIEATIPLGRVASPDDIASAVVFLASPLARHVTGEILNVNGGSVLCG